MSLSEGTLSQKTPKAFVKISQCSCSSKNSASSEPTAAFTPQETVTWLWHVCPLFQINRETWRVCCDFHVWTVWTLTSVLFISLSRRWRDLEERKWCIEAVLGKRTHLCETEEFRNNMLFFWCLMTPWKRRLTIKLKATWSQFDCISLK